MKKRLNYLIILITFIAAVLSSCTPSSRNDGEDSKDVAEDQNDEKFDKKAEDDAEFAVKAADGGMLEVKLGELAQTNASNPEVKEFAKMMVDEHSKANEELKTIAASKNISLPSALSDKCQKDYDDLAEKRGEDFDKAYTDFMVKDHKEDLDNFKDQAEKGNDSELRSWAAGKVATLEHHLEMSRQAESAAKNDRQSSSMKK